jgi:uncharacterized DUF497 family protein
MKFRYNDVKNAELIHNRGVGFEEIIYEISNGNLLNIVDHHNVTQYPNQKIMHVRCLGVVYCVPYVTESQNTIFLKTLYPSRKATKRYAKNNDRP